MEFGKKIIVEPLKLSDELVGSFYDTNNPEFQRDAFLLARICEIFKNRKAIHPITSNDKFICYIERKAFDAFVRFANETYELRGHEATGLIVGYYFCDKDDPETTFIVGTNFLKATGPTTRVTCEFSYEDGVRHSKFCDNHKVLSLIWIHSHPGFGAFYSGTDDSTLRSLYYAPHQVGVVVDNLQHQILGYKMYGADRKQENIYIFDLDQSDDNHLHFVYTDHVRNLPKKQESIGVGISSEQDAVPSKEEIAIDYGVQQEKETPIAPQDDAPQKGFSDKDKGKSGFFSLFALIISLMVLFTSVAMSMSINKKSREIDCRLGKIEQYIEKSAQESKGFQW